MKHKITDAKLLEEIATVRTNGKYCADCRHAEYAHDERHVYEYCCRLFQGRYLNHEDQYHILRCEQCLQMFKEMKK